MRFSIQVQDESKMFFHSLPAAEKATGLNRQTIRSVLERGNGVYHRKADHKLFHISKEDPILIAKIEGEEFFSLEEIQTKLGLSPTIFLNQINNGKFAKKIDWISDELFPEERSKAKQQKKSDEFEILRAEMKSQFQMLQEKIDWLSAKVEKLETEKAALASCPAPKSDQKPIFELKRPFRQADFTLESLAEIIRNGIVGEIQVDGPRTRKNVLVNNKFMHLPTLVKEIMQNHILPTFPSPDDPKFQEEIQEAINLAGKDKKLNIGHIASNKRKIRELDSGFISEVSKEIMKMI